MLVQKGIHLPSEDEVAEYGVMRIDRIRMPRVIGGTEEEIRAAWLEDRKSTIGASDIPIIMGTSKFKSRFTLWHEKMGNIEADSEESARQMCGNELEDGIARVFAKLNPGVGRLVDPKRIGIIHPIFHYNVASIDRFLFLGEPGNDRLTQNANWIPFEIKMVDAFAKKDWDNLEIPQAYYDQVQNQLDASGRSKAILMALFGGNTPGVWTVWRDMERCVEIGREVANFKRSMERNEAPFPDDDSESTTETLKGLYQTIQGGMLAMDADTAEAIRTRMRAAKQLKRLDDIYKKLEAIQGAADNLIRSVIGPATGIAGMGLEATWKGQDLKFTDKDALAKDEEYPAAKARVAEIEAKYKGKREIRVLRTKLLK